MLIRARRSHAGQHADMWPESLDPLGNLAGLLRHRAKDRPATVEEMDEAIRSRMAGKFASREKP